MDYCDKAEGLRFARAAAITGDHMNWLGVETKMIQVGYADASLWFEDRSLRSGINELCADSCKRMPLGDLAPI